MSGDEARRPIRAGQAYLDTIKDDPESQAALRRVQMGLQAFGAAVRAVIGPMNAAQNAALGNAMRGDFERLYALVDAHPDLKEAAGALEQALRATKEGDEQRRADMAKRFEHVLPALEDPMPRQAPPAFDDPKFWASIRPIGGQIEDAAREAVRGQAENRAPAGAGKRRRRINRAAVEQQILEHLVRHPHDTAVGVAVAAGCSVGVVCMSPAWKANRKRLRAAKELKAKSGKSVDPIALDLQDYLTDAGDAPAAQLREHRRAQEAIDAEIDQRDRELYRQIAEYERQHPNATPQQVARALGCTAGDVERRRLWIDRLTREQPRSGAADDPKSPRPRRHRRRV